MIQSLSNARGYGATTFATPRVNIHDGRSSLTMSVPLLLVNVQHITNTRALSNRRCVIPQSEKSCATTSFTVYILPTLSRRGCPHLVVRYPFIQVIRYATSTLVWLESYDVNRSLRYEIPPQTSGSQGVPQRRSPRRGEGSSMSCYRENNVSSQYCIDWMWYIV